MKDLFISLKYLFCSFLLSKSISINKHEVFSFPFKETEGSYQIEISFLNWLLFWIGKYNFCSKYSSLSELLFIFIFWIFNLLLMLNPSVSSFFFNNNNNWLLEILGKNKYYIIK